MPEMSNRPPLQGKPESIDPIAFDDETVFGLDPAVHWVLFNGQREQFPSIVPHIVEHWNDLEWLTKLVERAGFNTRIYDENTNPRGILTHVPHDHGEFSDGIRYIRYFALRVAGMTVSVCEQMFAVTSNLHASPDGKSERIVAKPVEQELATMRKKMKTEAKK